VEPFAASIKNSLKRLVPGFIPGHELEHVPRLVAAVGDLPAQRLFGYAAAPADFVTVNAIGYAAAGCDY
jgi:hypothetical protein